MAQSLGKHEFIGFASPLLHFVLISQRTEKEHFTGIAVSRSGFHTGIRVGFPGRVQTLNELSSLTRSLKRIWQRNCALPYPRVCSHRKKGALTLQYFGLRKRFCEIRYLHSVPKYLGIKNRRQAKKIRKTSNQIPHLSL